MRTIAPLASLVFLILLAAPADAQKPTDHVGARPAWDLREGGEDIPNAIVMELPFLDTGATCDNIDDYDEVCPYTGSTSPDVVYTFTPDHDSVIDIDLGGSSYDTKVYLYDQDLVLVACNDDFYPDYTSLLEFVPVQAGIQYYVVVDGYGGDCGEYVISAGCEQPPCISLECPVDAVIEGEPYPGAGYVDTYNGGCDAAEPVFQQLHLPAGADELVFCGSTGWYENGGEQRDTDWFELTPTGDEITVYAESSLFMSVTFEIVDITDCEDFITVPSIMGICSQNLVTIPTTPGQVLFLRVRPTSPTRQVCAQVVDEYLLRITGLGGVVRTESTSWSAIKRLYE